MIFLLYALTAWFLWRLFDKSSDKLTAVGSFILAAIYTYKAIQILWHVVAR